jgi:hypothetical protein
MADYWLKDPLQESVSEFEQNLAVEPFSDDLLLKSNSEKTEKLG